MDILVQQEPGISSRMPAINHPNKMGDSQVLKTKFCCTIGPSNGVNLGSNEKKTLIELVNRGMSICRLNLAHCTHDFAAQVIQDLRSHLDETGQTTQVAIWLDINGPKVR